MAKLTGDQAGMAGEYLAAGELSRRGFIASLTRRNARGVDILVTNLGATKTIGIQVKTNQGDHKRWIVGKKAEAYRASGLFYVFVNLHHGGDPTYHVVPSKVVADFARTKSGSMRTFEDKHEDYLDKWGLLRL